LRSPMKQPASKNAEPPTTAKIFNLIFVFKISPELQQTQLRAKV
jgi:hypothetical protein